jgi:hypothetical protein
MITRDLKIELSLAEYANLTLAEKVEHYNNKTIERAKRVLKADLENYLLSIDKYHVILGSAVPEVAEVAEKFKLFLAARGDTVDILNPLITQGLDTLKLLDILSQAQINTILAMGREYVHISQVNSLLPKKLRESDVVKTEAL